MSNSHPSPADAAIDQAQRGEAVHDPDGHTNAGWVACGGVMLTSVVAGAALIVSSVALVVVAGVVLVGSLAVAGLLGRRTAG